MSYKKVLNSVINSLWEKQKKEQENEIDKKS